MRYLGLVPVMFLSFCSMAPAVEMVNGNVKLEEDEKVSLTRCKAEGGCTILTQQEFVAMLKYYTEKAYVIGTQSCGRKSI